MTAILPVVMKPLQCLDTLTSDKSSGCTSIENVLTQFAGVSSLQVLF